MSAPAEFDPAAFLVEQAARVRARDAKLAPDPGALARTTALIQMIDGLLAKPGAPVTAAPAKPAPTKSATPMRVSIITRQVST